MMDFALIGKCCFAKDGAYGFSCIFLKNHAAYAVLARRKKQPFALNR